MCVCVRGGGSGVVGGEIHRRRDLGIDLFLCVL